MNIYLSSDLHYGDNSSGDQATAKLAAELNKRSQPDDILVLAGDLAAGDHHLAHCLSLFAGFRGRKCYVLGNHDIWSEMDDALVREMMAANALRWYGFSPLDLDEPLVFGSVGLAGNMGWYDYSFAEPALGIPLTNYETKTFPGELSPLWGDARFARWNMTDPAVTDIFVRRLESQLCRLEADPRVTEVIVVTHHVPTKRLLAQPRCLIPKRWRFANVFLGSERFAEVIVGHSKVRLAACGHIHLSRSTRIGGTEFLSIGSDYRSKELITWDGCDVKRESFSH